MTSLQRSQCLSRQLGGQGLVRPDFGKLEGRLITDHGSFVESLSVDLEICGILQRSTRLKP